MNTKTIIQRYAQYYGGKTAIVQGDRRLSFQEVNERSNRLANGLLELGVRKGDKVGVIARNCFQFIETWLARYKIGVVEVWLTPYLSHSELAYRAKDSGLNTLIVAEDQLSKINRSELEDVKNFIAISGTPEGWIDYESLISGSSVLEPQSEVSDEEIEEYHKSKYPRQTTFRMWFTEGAKWMRDKLQPKQSDERCKNCNKRNRISCSIHNIEINENFYCADFEIIPTPPNTTE